MARQSRTAAARRSAAARRTDTDDPSRSRDRALRVLFQADIRGVAPSVTLSRLDGDPAARALLDERDVLSEDEPVLPDPGAGPHTSPASAPDPADGPTGAMPAAGPGSGRRVPGRVERWSDDPAADQPAGVGASGWSDTAPATEVAPLDGFTRSLVLGVEEHRTEVEALISSFARRWAISRMPVVDRNVLRLATYELLYEPTPPAVVLDEAIGLAKRMSTDDSGRFVNGVLESIRQQLASQGPSGAQSEQDAEPADSAQAAPDAEPAEHAGPQPAADPEAELEQPTVDVEPAVREGAPGDGDGDIDDPAVDDSAPDQAADAGHRDAS